jgi:hypothetical protein
MFCAKVKEFLSQNKIEYIDRNIVAEEAALAGLEKLGYMGFDRPKLESILRE